MLENIKVFCHSSIINEIKPQIAVPTHYGCIVGKIEDANDFKKLLNPEIKCLCLIN